MYTDGYDDWISLGDISDISCIVNTNECPNSIPGVTVLAWIKFWYGGNGGIISSYGRSYSPGFGIGCAGNNIK